MLSGCDFAGKWHHVGKCLKHPVHFSVETPGHRMSQTTKNALVPVKPKKLPVKQSAGPRYNLVTDHVTFTSRADVRERLPDILGKALALIWIDREFADVFARDPQGTLESEGIVLPENMAIEFQKPGTDRPRIVVYERRPNSNFKLRILYLQLVMMAGR